MALTGRIVCSMAAAGSLTLKAKPYLYTVGLWSIILELGRSNHGMMLLHIVTEAFNDTPDNLIGGGGS